MKTSLTNFRNDLEERMLDLLAHQWSQLGGAIVDPMKHESDYALDPEALVLFTCGVGRREMRIFDDMLDWLAVNGRLLNGSRLKRMARDYSFFGTQVLAPVSEILRQQDSRIRWQLPSSGQAEEDLAITDNSGASSWGEPDPIFLKHGFRRGKVELRGLAAPFNRTRTAAGLLCLRSLFGANARAEIILYLLNNQPVHPRKVARDTGYSQKNVQDTMVDMSASGWLIPVHLEGRRKHYRMVHLEVWQQFLFAGRPIPKWQTWPPIFKSLELVWAKTREMRADVSESIEASETKLLIRSLSALLLKADRIDEAETLKSCGSIPDIADHIFRIISG